MAGNSNSGNREAQGKAVKYGGQLAQRARKAILNTFDCIERGYGDNQPRIISEILADAFIANPLKFLDTASKLMPKDINLEVLNIAQANAMTDAELADLIAERARKRRELEALEGECEELQEDQQVIDVSTK